MADKIKNIKPDKSKALLMILALLCSIVLWIYVRSVEGSEDTVTFNRVNVVYEGVDNLRDNRGYVITSADDTTVRVSVTGDSRVLARLRDGDLTAVIDLSSVNRSGHYSQTPRITFPSNINSSELTVKTTSPGTVNFYVDKLTTITIDVKGENNSSTAEGYSAAPMEFYPSTIKISGPESELAKVKDAWISVEREDLDSTLTFDSSFVLRDADKNIITSEFITPEIDTVSVTVPIIAIKEVDLVVSFISGAGASEETITKKIEPGKVTLSGDAEVLEGVNSILLATIDLGKVDGSFSETYPIVIPNDTEIIGGVTEATVSIEILGLETKRVTVPRENLSCTNITEGFVAEIMDTSLANVTLRGTAEALEGVSAENVRAVADLTDYGTATGIYTVPVRIYVSGTTEVGAIGEYKIYVSISKGD